MMPNTEKKIRTIRDRVRRTGIGQQRLKDEAIPGFVQHQPVRQPVPGSRDFQYTFRIASGEVIVCKRKSYCISTS